MLCTLTKKYINKGSEICIFEIGKNKLELGYNKFLKVLISKNCVSEEKIDCFKLENNIEQLEIGKSYELLQCDFEITDDNYILVDTPTKKEYLHRMVAFLFGDRNGMTYEESLKTGKLIIDHVDGNKHRNIPENLEYVYDEVNLYRASKNNYFSGFSRLKEKLNSASSHNELMSMVINIYDDMTRNN